MRHSTFLFSKGHIDLFCFFIDVCGLVGALFHRKREVVLKIIVSS